MCKRLVGKYGRRLYRTFRSRFFFSTTSANEKQKNQFGTFRVKETDVRRDRAREYKKMTAKAEK